MNHQYPEAVKKRGRFLNPYSSNSRRKPKDFLLWQLGYYNDPFPPLMPPSNFRYPNPRDPLNEDLPQVMWINHCTFFIKMGDLNILTDPIWCKRCSPWWGPGHRPDRRRWQRRR